MLVNSRIHETIRTTDPRHLDAYCDGVLAAYFVSGEFISFNWISIIAQPCPCSYTKASLVASIIFVLDKKTDLISAPHALVYFGIVIFLVYFKLSSILLGIHDPFVPFENLFCALFMGGVWDSLAKILGRGQNKEGENKEVKNK